MTLEERLVQGALRLGMTREEAEVAARDAVRRQEWRLRRGVKECRICREDKPVVEFHRDASKRDGLRNSCRSCRSPVSPS